MLILIQHTVSQLLADRLKLGFFLLGLVDSGVVRLLWSTGCHFLGAVQRLPQFTHKYLSLLPFQKASQTDLHLAWIRLLFVQLTEDKLDEGVIFKLQQLSGPPCNPWLKRI